MLSVDMTTIIEQVYVVNLSERSKCVTAVLTVL